MWQYQNTDELYHHGVVGMRWGHRKSKPSRKFFSRVRRNSVVKGIRRVANERKNNATVTSNNEGIRNRVDNTIHNRISYKKATNDQLKRATERIKLENAYQEAVNARMRLNPKKQSIVTRAVKKIFSEAIAPAAMNAGRTYMENFFKRTLEGEKTLSAKELYKQKVDDLATVAKEWESREKIRKNKESYINATKKAAKNTKKTLHLNTSSGQSIENLAKKKKKK